MRAFGVVHERDLSLNALGTLLRGRDRVMTPDGGEPAGTAALQTEVRFHLHPAIKLRQHSANEIYMTAPDGESWLFSCHDAPVSIEEDIFFADPSGVRKSQQLLIVFDARELSEIQWVLSRETLTGSLAGV